MIRDRNRTVRLESWGGPHGDVEQVLAIETKEELIDAIQALTNEHSAILTIEAGDDWLAIDSSNGLLAASVQLAEHAFDLVGDAAATGTIPYVRGGQLVTNPRRYLVNLEQTLAAALQFFCTGAVAVTSGWDEQGPDSAWATQD